MSAMAEGPAFCLTCKRQIDLDAGHDCPGPPAAIPIEFIEAVVVINGRREEIRRAWWVPAP